MLGLPTQSGSGDGEEEQRRQRQAVRRRRGRNGGWQRRLCLGLFWSGFGSTKYIE